MAAALERARSGAGPTLVEAFTYRMGAHTTSDDPTRYRTTAEREAWKLKDPIERVRAHISAVRDRRRGVPRRGRRPAPRPSASTCAPRCRALPDPPPTSMFDHLYATEHPVVERERVWLSDVPGAASPTPRRGQ